MTTIPGPRRSPPPDSSRHVPPITTDLASNPALYAQPPVIETPDAYDYYRLAIAGNRTEPLPPPPPPAPSSNGPSKSFDTAPHRVATADRPRSSRSIPALPSQKRSVRDIAAQFNQAGSGNVPVPKRHDAYRSASMPAHKAGQLQQAPLSPTSPPAVPALPAAPQSQRNRLQKPAHQRRKSMEDGRKRISKLLGMPSGSVATPSRPPLERNPSSQQVLFGEVSSGAPDPAHIGFGIPRKMPRRGSEGSMRQPNAMFPRPSNLDLSNTASRYVPHAPFTADHQRSRSDMTDFNLASLPTHSKDSFQSGLPPRLLQNLEDGRYADPRLVMPSATSLKDRRPVTPPSNLSFPQMAAESVRLGVSGDQPRLKAYIKDSPPKTSPPLRSSRPRQQVSTYAQQNSEQQESGTRRLSALQELSNAVYQVPKSSIRLGDHPSLKPAVNGLGSHSAPGTDDGATDFDTDTPPASALPGERSEGFETNGADTSKSSRLAPALTIQTQSIPSKAAPVLMSRSGESTTPPDESKESGMIQIMLGDRSLLTPQTGTSAPPNLSSMAGRHRDSDFSQSPESAFTPFMIGRSDKPHTFSWMSSNPATPGRFTVDSSGYNAIHNILTHYEEGNTISPRMIDELQPHVLLEESDMSPQDAVVEMLRQIDNGKADSATGSGPTIPGPAPELAYKPQGAESWASIPPSNASHETDIEDNASFIQDDEQTTIMPAVNLHPRKDSGTLPAEDNHLLHESQRPANRSSMLTTSTATSEQPSLPEIRDTGGILNVAEDSRISILPQFPEFVPEDMSPTVAGHSSLMFERDMTGQSSTAAEFHRQSLSSSQLRHSESATPTDDTSAPGGQSVDQKRLTKRQNIVNELINTEISFHRDMTVVEDIYMGTTKSCDALREEDIKVLFANTPAIVRFSRAFADSLKENSRGVYQKPPKEKRPSNMQSKVSDVNGRPASLATTNSGYNEAFSEGTDDERDRRSRIGHVFIENLSKMEKVYAEYLKNHEAANKKLQDLIQQEEVKVWMHECETYARDLSNAWNLDAMLIKPTQRLMKYPLLLEDLFKATPNDHPDFTALEMASKELRHMSHRINEAKKRADLIDRVVNPGKGNERRDISERLGNLMKGRTDKVKQNVGTLEHVEDPEYVALSQKFGSQHLQLQVVMKDMEMHRTNGEASIKRLLSLADAWCGIVEVGATPSPELESKWRRWAQAIQELRMFAWADHVIAVERHCIEPIKTCLSLFDRPQNLIKERKKRLPQYANFRAKRESGSSIKEDLQQQADQFMALNDTLKDELPKLYGLSARLVGGCLKNWVDLTGTWNSVAQRKLQTIIDDLNTSSWNQIVDAFHSDHQYGITDITSLAICNGSLQNDTSNFLASSANSVKSDGRVSSRPSYNETNRRGPSFESPYDWRQPSFENQRTSGGSTNLRPSTDNGRPGWPAMTHHQRLRSHSGSNTARLHTSNGQAPPLPPPPPPPAPVPQSGQMNSTSFFWQKTPPLATATAPTYESAGSNRYYAGGADSRANAWNQHAPATYPQEMQQASFSSRPSASDTTLVGSAYTAGSSLTAANSASSSRTHTFSSAVPMSNDYPYRSTSPHRAYSGSRAAGDPQQSQQRVLWLAASLFDFKLDTARKEAGYPYLTYDPGEIFDVIGERGELWLARNQDDANGPVGWIWEKHFAKLINDDS